LPLRRPRPDLAPLHFSDHSGPPACAACFSALRSSGGLTCSNRALRREDCSLPQPQALLPIPKAPRCASGDGPQPIPRPPLLRGLPAALLPHHRPAHPDPAPLRPVDLSLQPEPWPRPHRELRAQEVPPPPGHPGPSVDPKAEVHPHTRQKPEETQPGKAAIGDPHPARLRTPRAQDFWDGGNPGGLRTVAADGPPLPGWPADGSPPGQRVAPPGQGSPPPLVATRQPKGAGSPGGCGAL